MTMDLKERAAERAVALLLELDLGEGLALGLGTGSTAERVIKKLAELHHAGRLDFVGVPTSARTEQLARRLQLPLTTLDERPVLDLAIDGADEVDPDLNLLKGGGGAHTREKIVARAAERYLIVVDDSKLVPRLGTKRPLPVEVISFGRPLVERELRALGGEPQLRLENGRPFRTDEGNLILDCRFPPDVMEDLPGLAAAVKAIPGVVEHGLFPGMADRVVVASRDGTQVLERSAS
jgi:ribose 5-phosphate isomerase A